MNPILSIVLQLSVALTLAISVASAEEPPVLSVFVSSPQGIEPYLRGAPMRLLVHISNTSLQPASVLINNGSDYFTCECVMKDGQPLKAVPPDAVREKPDTTDIAAGKSMVRSVYLNNYYTFASDGEFQTTWKVNIPILLLGKLQSYTISGIHGSKIAAVSDDRTREEIRGYYSFFQNANDEQIKIDMLMGIASVRTAIGLSYLERCLSSDRYDNLAAFHLANRWANDKSGREVMDRFLATSINPHALQLRRRV